MKTNRFACFAVIGLLLSSSLALAQSTVLDQHPAPVPSAGNANGDSELLLQSFAVPGGTVYTSLAKNPGTGQLAGVASNFVPTAATSPLRYLALTNGKSDAGVPMTATPGTPTGTVGVSRTAGTSLFLAGEATSSSAKTNKVTFEFSLPETYVAGTNIPIVVNCIVTNTGTLTGASTTITPTLYSESAAGVETTQGTITAQQFDKTGETLTFTASGTGLTPNSRVTLEIVMLVTSASGANSGQINSVAFQG